MSEIVVPAIRLMQGTHELYSLAIDGKLIPRIATISRVRRDNAAELFGYQRPEIASHINAIRTYLEATDPMLPNAVVVAFDARVHFLPASATNDGATIGFLTVPTAEDGEVPAGWVVDGQQRLAAIRQARIDSFPIFVVAFIADDEATQRAQFILVNSVRPLPAGLINELLPDTEALLPPLLRRRQLPALLTQRLNLDSDSPFENRVRTATNPTGTIRDNSLLRMLENSLSEGALYRFRPTSDAADVEQMLRVVKNFWEAVSWVFSDAWGLPPRKSRLVHGAGIVSLGHLMDAIADRQRSAALPSARDFERELAPLAPHCSWTAGYWNFGPGQQRRWNELQNTTKDIELLTNYLRVLHRSTMLAAS